MVGREIRPCRQTLDVQPVHLGSLEARPRDLHFAAAEDATELKAKLEHIRSELETLGETKPGAANDAHVLPVIKEVLPQVFAQLILPSLIRQL